MDTLPGYHCLGQEVVFLSINSGIYSARMGRYFARPTNLFWTTWEELNLSSGTT